METKESGTYEASTKQASKPFVVMVKNTSEEPQDVVLFGLQGEENKSDIRIDSATDGMTYNAMRKLLLDNEVVFGQSIFINKSYRPLDECFVGDRPAIIVKHNRGGVKTTSFYNVYLNPYQRQSDRAVLDEEFSTDGLESIKFRLQGWTRLLIMFYPGRLQKTIGIKAIKVETAVPPTIEATESPMTMEGTATTTETTPSEAPPQENESSN